MRQTTLALGLFVAAGMGATTQAAPGFMLAELPTVIGGIDEALVTHEIWTHQADIKECYEDGLDHQSRLSGALEVKFLIGEDGVVISCETRSSTLGDEEVEACILNSFYQMDFPAPSRGRPYVISKFTFQPL